MTAFSISAKLSGLLTITEVLASADSPARKSGQLQQVFANYNQKVTYNATSTPNVDKPAVDLSVTIASSPETIDLTAVPSARDVNDNVDLSGSKLVAVLLYARAANAADLTVGFGASNPYPIFGASKELILAPGELIEIGFQSGSETSKPAVSGTVKNIDVAGTVADVLYGIAIFGTQPAP